MRTNSATAFKRSLANQKYNIHNAIRIATERGFLHITVTDVHDIIKNELKAKGFYIEVWSSWVKITWNKENV